MHVDLGGVEVAVAEPLLELIGRDTPLCLIRGKGMRQTMQRDLLGDAGKLHVLGKKLLHTPL